MPPTPPITVVPLGGLANRMRVVVSAAVLSRKLVYPREVRIAWRPLKECFAQFEQIFEPLPVVFPITIDAGTFKDSLSRKYNFRLSRWMRRNDYDIQWENFSHKQMMDAFPEQSVYISSCIPLCHYEPSIVPQLFRPVEELREKIDLTTDLFTDHTLGVHIRRTDNKMSILHSPLEKFKQRIAAYFDEFPDGKVFLCSDEEGVKADFRNTFGERLITRSACLKRNSLQGIQDAIIDLWSLSHTHKMLGSFYSSYSETATELGGQPLEIINTEVK